MVREITPSPIYDEVTEDTVPKKEKGSLPPWGIAPIGFTSTEDMKESLNRKGERSIWKVPPDPDDQRLTESEYQSILRAMAPTLEERYKLQKGWDGERRWYEDKECNFQGHDVNNVPNEEMTRIKIVGQWTFDIRYQEGAPRGQIRRMVEKAYQARSKDYRSQSELDGEARERTFQRELEPKKQKVQSVDTAEDAMTALEKGLTEEWQRIAKPSARSAGYRSSLTHAYHTSAPPAMSSSSPPPPQVPPASFAYSGRGHGPWRNTEADITAAAGPEAKKFRYVEPERPATGSWDRSRDKAITAGSEDWLSPEGGDVKPSAADESMISELSKFCTRCNREGHCAGDAECSEAGSRPLAPDAVPVTPRSEERRVGKECRSRWSPYH